MTSNAPPTEGYFKSGDLNIHYLDWGNEGATPFILLHHVQSSAHTWDTFAQRIRGQYRVLAMDMRGHGDSDWAGEGHYTTEEYASDVVALIKHLNLPRFIAMGGSTGGRVAMLAAAMVPDKAAALIMEDVGAVRPPSIAGGFAERAAAGDPEFDTVEEWAKQMQGTNTRMPYAVFQHLAQHNTKRLPNGKLGVKRDLMIQKDFIPLELWRYVEQVQAPFLLMPGSESEIVGEDQQMKFKELRPEIEIITIKDAGHLIVHEQPEVFEKTVLDFLHRHGL
ncbi:MAG: alpha/beta hydrolase [Chloroflexi bacterium]|nr:MAG: alpha/beta hydrolase [Chloroflexota bacterium]